MNYAKSIEQLKGSLRAVRLGTSMQPEQTVLFSLRDHGQIPPAMNRRTAILIVHYTFYYTVQYFGCAL